MREEVKKAVSSCLAEGVAPITKELNRLDKKIDSKKAETKSLSFWEKN